MEEPKLELKKAKNQLSRLDLVKARAEIRTKRRIAEVLEKEQLKELELKKAQEISDTAKQGIVKLANDKKGKK